MSFLRTTGRLVYGKVLPRRPYRVLSGPLKGARFILGSLSGAGGGASVYYNQIEPSQTAEFVKELKPGHIVFDVGANVGYYTVLASRLVGINGIVAAFEPLIANLIFLHQHVSLNKANNVKVLPFAVSDSTGIESFISGGDRAMGKLDHARTGDILVPTVTIDEVAERLNLRPNILKIDVEGAENRVLAGARRTIDECKPAIFLSTHSEELRTSCLSSLKEAGYRVDPISHTDDPHEFLAKPLSV
jgi:FkbM family methyltransferase